LRLAARVARQGPGEGCAELGNRPRVAGRIADRALGLQGQHSSQGRTVEAHIVEGSLDALEGRHRQKLP